MKRFPPSIIGLAAEVTSLNGKFENIKALSGNIMEIIIVLELESIDVDEYWQDKEQVLYFSAKYQQESAEGIDNTDDINLGVPDFTNWSPGDLISLSVSRHRKKQSRIEKRMHKEEDSAVDSPGFTRSQEGSLKLAKS